MMNILIIEDNPMFQIKIGMFLQELGYRTQIVESLYEAEASFQNSAQYDLIISDVVLKDGTVFTLKNWPSLPTIFITAFEEFEYVRASLEIDNSIFITKPFSNLTLRAAILRLTHKPAIQKDKGITVFGKYKNPIWISINEILFITSEGNYSTIFTENQKKYVIKRSAKMLINEEIEQEVVRISRSTFVNRSKITSVHIAKNTIVVGQHALAVSKNFKRNIYEFHELNK